MFIAGDYTGNGVVDAADYNYWRTTFGSLNSLAADGNNNGNIDAGDYVLWRQRHSEFGNGASPVPEPSLRIVILGLVIGISGLRKSHGRYLCF